MVDHRSDPTDDSGHPLLSDRSDEVDSHAHFELLARIASKYYLDEMTQGGIAAEFHLTRQKVQRLLHEARELRIVEIHVYAAPELHLELEKKLKGTFGLQQVLVAPTDEDEQQRRRSVARVAAAYLERYLKDGMAVAVALGRNTSAIADFLHPAGSIDCTFVSAMGGSPSMKVSVSPNEVCTRLAARSGGVARPLYAPAFVESPGVRDMLHAQDAIAGTLDLARAADVALVGIGTPRDDSILVEAACLAPSETARLRQMGAVGEVLGHFFDANGQSVYSDLDHRLVGLTLAELRKIPHVVAVVSEEEKSEAILGALRTGLVHVLITEHRNAVALLRLAGEADM